MPFKHLAIAGVETLLLCRNCQKHCDCSIAPMMFEAPAKRTQTPWLMMIPRDPGWGGGWGALPEEQKPDKEFDLSCALWWPFSVYLYMTEDRVKRKHTKNICHETKWALTDVHSPYARVSDHHNGCPPEWLRSASPAHLPPKL